MHSFGYDLAYACTIDKINSQFVDYFNNTKVTMTYEGVDSTTQSPITLNCEMGPWEIVKGGSNRVLFVNMPIKSGTFTVSSSSYDLSTVSVIVAMQLGWVGSGSVSAAGEGDNTNLVFDMQEPGEVGSDPDSGQVSVRSVSDPNEHLTELAETIFSTEFATILISNQSNVSAILAQIETTPPNSAEWMKPMKWDYQYVEPSSGIAVLAILSVFTDRDLPPQTGFDTNILVEGHDFYVILSQPQVLQNLIQPGLPEAFGSGTSASDFAYHPTDGESVPETGYIQNTNEISTDTAKWAATTYYPKLSLYKITISSADVQTKFEGHCDITGLANAYITYDGLSTTTGSFDSSSHSITFSTPSTSINSQKHIPWYDWLGGIVIDPIIIAITNQVEDNVKEAVSNSIPTVTAEVTNTVKWMGTTAVANDGGLEDAIWYRGALSS